MEGNELEGQDYQMGVNDKNQYQQITGSGYQKGKGKVPLSGQKYQNQNLYQQQTEEMYQQEQAQAQYSQQGKDVQLQDMNRNSCPIHGERGKGKYEQGGISKIGGRTEGNRYEYINEQVNNALGENEEEANNYNFYESKNVTKKLENIASVNVQNYEKNVNKLNTLNIKNMAGQENLIRTANVIGMNQEVQGTQGLLGMQGISSSQGMQIFSNSQGYDISKVYIATRVTPVYSEIVNQNMQNLISGHICNVCGNPMGQGQINSSQQIVYRTSNNNCPIHGKEIIHQQYNGY